MTYHLPNYAQPLVCNFPAPPWFGWCNYNASYCKYTEHDDDDDDDSGSDDDDDDEDAFVRCSSPQVSILPTSSQ